VKSFLLQFCPGCPILWLDYCVPSQSIFDYNKISNDTSGTLKHNVLLKHEKSTLDKDELSNYCPISKVSIISKITERVVKFRLTDRLTSNKLRKSAYCNHHSTETALLYIHDHLINEIGLQKVSCLCLLDLSAAFDTIDHDILITHLSSWFGIHGSVLSWFKSYLSSRSFRAKCDNNLSSFHTSSCGVPQGSVLCRLLFLIYTTPLSTPISSLSINYRLYADDTQLFFSFHPLNFWLKHFSHSKRSSTDLFLDDC